FVDLTDDEAGIDVELAEIVDDDPDAGVGMAQQVVEQARLPRAEVAGEQDDRHRFPESALAHGTTPALVCSTVSPVNGNESHRVFRRGLVTVETAAWPAATALVSETQEDARAKEYSPARLAGLTAERCDAGRGLGMPHTRTRAGEPDPVRLGASAGWSAHTGTRAAGRSGSFLPGCAADAAPSSSTD